MKKLYAILILALGGLSSAIYLTISAFNYVSGDKSSLFCDVSDTFSCSQLFAFDFTNIFGLPFPAIAMMVYPVLITLALVGIVFKIKDIFKAIFVFSIGGILFNGYIIYNEFVVMVFCLACAFCTLVIATIAVLSFIGIKNKEL